MEDGGPDHLVRVFVSLLCDVRLGPSLRKELLLKGVYGGGTACRGAGAVPRWSHRSLLHSDVIAVLNTLSDAHRVTKSYVMCAWV